MDRRSLHQKIRELFSKEIQDWTPLLEQSLPSKWEKHGNLVLFPANAFQHPEISKNSQLLLLLYPLICKLMKVSKIARRTGPISPHDPFRRPQVEILYGSDGWVSKIENSIKFQWDVTKCMFSSGNISEKQRISSWNLQGQIVVDLFAGIGYFTLNYLVHARAELVYACEWSPDAIEALRINLERNGVSERCIVLEGDNALVCPEGVADHVNLGLIPSSEGSWSVACRALKTSGGILHIHGNVDLKRKKTEGKSNGICSENENKNENQGPKGIPIAWTDWAEYVVSEIRRILEESYNSDWEVRVLEIFKVKSYGPCVDHLVLDLKCEPGLKLKIHQMNGLDS